MITLINPPFHEKTTYYFNYVTAKYPNPSLAYLGGYLEKKGIPFRIIDAKFYDLSVEEVLEMLQATNPGIIGITSTTTEINHVQAMISRIKRCFPASFVLLGGVHATALPRETLAANDDLDALVAGEGESALEMLAGSVDPYSVLPEIPGMYFRRGGRIVNSPPKVYGSGLEGYGKAAFHLWSKADRYFVSTYRGCPFPCSFCFRALGRSPRLRDPADVLEELEYIATRAPGCDLLIVDATFGLDRSHTEYILKEIIRRGINTRIGWRCATRVDVVDRGFLELMKAAGCRTVSFGIESGADRILKATGKNTTVARCIEAVREAKEVGLETVGYYLFGHPGETKRELNDTLRLIWRMNCDNIAVGIMVPWPGTRVFDLARRNSGGYRLVSMDFSRFDKYFGSVMEFENFSLSYLEFMRLKAFVCLYLKNHRFLDLVRFLWSVRGAAFKKSRHLARRILGRGRYGGRGGSEDAGAASYTKGSS